MHIEHLENGVKVNYWEVVFQLSRDSAYPEIIAKTLRPMVKTNEGRIGIRVSTAYVCSFCGKLWGRKVTLPEPPPAPYPYWRADMRNCPDHGGGSLLSDEDWHSIEDEPIELIKWEVAHSATS